MSVATMHSRPGLGKIGAGRWGAGAAAAASSATAADDAARDHDASSTPQWTTGTAGRLCECGLTETDRNVAVAIHLSPFASVIGVGPLALLIPLVLWLVRKERSAFNDDHGREIINFGLSQIVIHAVLAITLIGILIMPVLWVVAVVSLIRAAIAAGRGEYFRYPMTFRFLP